MVRRPGVVVCVAAAEEWKAISEMGTSFLERQKNVMAQGRTSPVSKDASQYIEGIYPTHADSAHRCYITTPDGKKYTDFVSGLGAISVGYSNEAITDAAIRQCRKGPSFSLPHTLEVEVAEILSGEIPCLEKSRFFKNGRDASDAAIRIARAATGRSLVASKGYHGSSDIWTSLTPPALGVKDEFKIVSLDTVQDIERSKLAAVIVEAIELDDSVEYQEWIKNLREQCRKAGTVFIVDEIVTGFRYPKLCVSNAWGLDPDIILLGKGMANGYPLSMIGGKKAIMDCGDWFFSMTFSGEAVSLAACKETIKQVNQRNLNDLLFYGKRLQEKLNALHHEIQFKGYGTRCLLNTSNETTQLFMQECAKAGILFGKAHFFHFAHLEEAVESIVMSAVEPIVEKIKRGQVRLEGKKPVEFFRR